MILRRSIGVVLVVMGLYQGILSLRNLWTISAAWNDFDRISFAGIHFLGDPHIPDSLQRLWTENLIVGSVMLLAVIGGSVLLFGAKLHSVDEEK